MTKKKIYTCPDCPGHTRFISFQEFKSHKTVHGARRYRCSFEDCPRSFRWRSSLASHHRAHRQRIEDSRVAHIMYELAAPVKADVFNDDLLNLGSDSEAFLERSLSTEGSVQTLSSGEPSMPHMRDGRYAVSDELTAEEDSIASQMWEKVSRGEAHPDGRALLIAAKGSMMPVDTPQDLLSLTSPASKSVYHFELDEIDSWFQ